MKAERLPSYLIFMQQEEHEHIEEELQNILLLPRLILQMHVVSHTIAMLVDFLYYAEHACFEVKE